MIPDKIIVEIEKSTEFKSTNSIIAHDSISLKKILRSKIYSNKPLAVLRELSCNSYDSHVAANKQDTQFNVVLPSVLEPTLRIRDFGIGLDEFSVRNVLFSYGDSIGNNTKVLSNDQHGCFHIGAKAPLSYTNAFQVVAIKDGVKNTFTIFIGDNEDDYIDLLAKEQTDECNGVEFIIPIKQEDIHTFVKTAESLFQFWQPLPKITGNSSYKQKQTKYLLKGNGWAFIEADDYYKTPYCIMGGVPYKISYNSIPNLDNKYYQVLQKEVLLYANIGDVNVNAGREELEYTEKTIKFIKEKIDSIYMEAAAEIDLKIKSIKNEYEARKLYYDYFGFYGKLAGIFTDILKNVGYEIKYNDKKITDYRFDLTGSFCKKCVVFTLKENLRWGAKKKFKLTRYEDRLYDFIGNQNLQNYNSGLSINKHFYFIKELNKDGSHKEISVTKLANYIRHYLTVTFNKCIYDEQINVLAFESNIDFVNFVMEIGLPQNSFVDIKTIQLPPKVIKPRQPRIAKTARTENADVYENGNWKAVQVDIENESGYYVTRWYSNHYLDFDSSKILSGENNENIFYSARDFLNEKEAMLDKIYAFTPKIIEKLDKKKWKSFSSYVKDKLERYNKTQDVNIIPIERYYLSTHEEKFIEYIKNGIIKFDKNYILHKLSKEVGLKDIGFKDYKALNGYFEFVVKQYDDALIEKNRDSIRNEIKKYKLIDNLEYSDYKDDCLLYIEAKYKQLKNGEEKKKREELEIVTF